MKNTIVLLPAVLLLAGCATMQTPQQARTAQAAQTQEQMIARENQLRMSGRIESLEMEIGRLSQELDAMRGQFDMRCAAIEQKSEADKREMVSKITAELDRMIKQAAPAPATQTATKTSGYGYEHIVRPGETLSTIAKAYNVTTKAIIDANKISNPNILSVGQKLFIPE